MNSKKKFIKIPFKKNKSNLIVKKLKEILGDEFVENINLIYIDFKVIKNLIVVTTFNKSLKNKKAWNLEFYRIPNER